MKATLITATIAVASTVLVTACGTPAQQSSMTRYPSGTSSYSSTQPAYTSQYGYVDSIQVVTAAQSGAQYGYRLVLPQVVLIPILYVVQEMTVRLGLVTGQGHGALIRAHFGRGWALVSAATLFVA